MIKQLGPAACPYVKIFGLCGLDCLYESLFQRHIRDMPTPQPLALGIQLPDYPGELPQPTGRSRGPTLEEEIIQVASHVLFESLLDAVQGLVAVLNEHRQILALNDRLLQSLGTGNLHEVLGLRLGEVLHCPHAMHAPEGCGTTEYCQTCGAAIAQVIALIQDHPSEQLCAIELSSEGNAHSNLFINLRILRLPGRQPIRASRLRLKSLAPEDVPRTAQETLRRFR